MTIPGASVELVIFAVTLVGVALAHQRTLEIALGGLVVLVAYKLGFTSFALVEHLGHEAKLLINLLGLLVGFELLSRHFEASRLPDHLPRILPDDWRGGLVLLAFVFVLSAFLDNIAACLVGGAAARTVYRGRVHIAFLAAIVAAANAGGAGSVLGDTTTTMMWIAGKSPLAVVEAALGAFAAFLVFGTFGALRQQKHQPIAKDDVTAEPIDIVRLGIVVAMLVAAVGTNIALDFPALGVWGALMLSIPLRRPAWHDVPKALRGSTFLLALVLSASMIPVDSLPSPTWGSTFVLGFVSAVFDNIPLTKLALEQGGYDWGFLAYAVGFGGSMMWFGSSAGVALSTLFPEIKSASRWITAGWFVPVGYVVGFFTMLGLIGWHPS